MDTHVADIMASLARLEEAVGGCRKDIQENHKVSVKRLDDHAKRVGSLERSRAKLVGGMAVISLAVGGLWGWLGLGRWG